MTQPATFRLGHLSDVHLNAVPHPRLRYLISKRLIGYYNWRRNRAHAMTAGTLERLVADLKAQAPDHIAVTGDLTNIAMREEFENARRWLDELGPPDKVTAIPGNHDAYVPGAHHRYRTLWAPWMRSDDAEFVHQGALPLHAAQGPSGADRSFHCRCVSAVSRDRPCRRANRPSAS